MDRATLIKLAQRCWRKNSSTIAMHDSKSLASKTSVAASAAIAEAVTAAARAAAGYTSILNGRFKGGYITRHYADPAHGIDAIQLEISQRIYMDEATFAYDEARAVSAQAVIRSLLEAA